MEEQQTVPNTMLLQSSFLHKLLPYSCSLQQILLKSRLVSLTQYLHAILLSPPQPGFHFSTSTVLRRVTRDLYNAKPSLTMTPLPLAPRTLLSLFSSSWCLVCVFMLNLHLLHLLFIWQCPRTLFSIYTHSSVSLIKASVVLTPKFTSPAPRSNIS